MGGRTYESESFWSGFAVVAGVAGVGAGVVALVIGELPGLVLVAVGGWLVFAFGFWEPHRVTLDDSGVLLQAVARRVHIPWAGLTSVAPAAWDTRRRQRGTLFGREGVRRYCRWMLELRRIRSETAAVKAALDRRGAGTSEAIDRIVALDAEQRRVAGQRDEVRARVKVVSKDVGRLRGQGQAEEAEARMAESHELGQQEKSLAAEADRLGEEVRQLLLRVPNVPSEEAPDGAGEADNVVLRIEGFDPESYGEHQRVPHWDIGTQLGILDIERATKISGAMFVMYRGWGARLLRAMVQLSLDRNADAFEEVRPPTLVRTETMVSTGHLPKFEEDAYHMERDDLWAIPTAEVPLTSLHSDEVLDGAALPLRYTAHTSCFRREAGSAGKDTRGLLRTHEFDKVELLALAADEAAAIACQDDVLARSEALLRELGLAYRVVDLCTGDLGNSARRTWDIDAYAPGVDMWLEVSSVSWFGDYQARRANIRYRPLPVDPAAGEGGGEAKPKKSATEVCHTVNGSAMGWPRTVAAYLETHRRPDGRVDVVEALRPYLGGAEVVPPG